ncbi:hypothetical protein [Methylosinus sporium]|uniref:hypothetical protein n=1 Tax=Methylosinus sporium TaxID=428 RepID=UPI001FCE40E0|nr:hypothetical protein [Methylosinus sporium]
MFDGGHLTHSKCVPVGGRQITLTFARALRDAAMASIRARSRGAGFDQPAISRYFLESHVDDALYLIGRDGLDVLESNVRFAVDEMIREALDNVRMRRTEN